MEAKEDIGNYYNSSQHRNACQSWKDTNTWMKMCKNMISFINGTIDIPGYKSHMGRNKYETSLYQNKLRELNKAGLLTIDSQPALFIYTYKTGELVNIKREYIAVSIPIVNLVQFAEKLLAYPVFVVIIAKKNVRSPLDKHHVCGYLNANVLNGIDVMCNIYNGTGLDESKIWGKHANNQPKRNNKIPLTLNRSRKNGVNYNSVNSIDPAKSVPLEFMLNWNEVTIKRKEFILDNISTVYIIDADWNDIPYKIFKIVDDIAKDMEIIDISFE